MSLTLLLAAGIVSVAGAVLSLALSRFEDAAKPLACLFGAISSALALGSGLLSIFGPAELLRVATVFPFADFSLAGNPLSGLLVTVISVLGLAAWIYGFSYFDEYRGRGVGKIGFYLNLFVISMIFVVSVDNAFWFLVFFEIMTLASYFLVVFDRSDQALRGGFAYFVMAHVGYLMIMVAFFIMAGAAGGSFEFADFRQLSLSPAAASAVFVLTFLGFGIKAGIVPFHSWLPMAHPEAPSNVSALMSGGMVKIGVFGIVKVCFDLLAASGLQLWWGFVVVAFGAASALFGIAYAVSERDIKKTLAYCTVENVGIILIGVGVAVFGVVLNIPAVAALGLMAALFHLLNHALYKGALFFGAGSVIYRVHSRSLDKMGGLAHAMPWTAAAFLVAAVALCAIPPLNGFASEWFTYQSLLGVAFGTVPLVKAFAVLAGAALAISGALAIVCFVKVYGVAFSGTPRSETAKKAREVPFTMTASNVVLVALCVALGVGAAWVAPVMDSIASATLGFAAPVQAVAHSASLANPATGAVASLLLIAVLVLALWLLLAGIRIVVGRTSGRGLREEPWDCGYLPDDSMVAQSTTFASAARMFFGALYDVRERVVSCKGAVVRLYERFVAGVARVEPLADRYLVDGVINVVDRLGRLAQRAEGGDYRVYISYIVAALVFFLILTVAIG